MEEVTEARKLWFYQHKNRGCGGGIWTWYLAACESIFTIASWILHLCYDGLKQDVVQADNVSRNTTRKIEEYYKVHAEFEITFFPSREYSVWACVFQREKQKYMANVS